SLHGGRAGAQGRRLSARGVERGREARPGLVHDAQGLLELLGPGPARGGLAVELAGALLQLPGLELGLLVALPPLQGLVPFALEVGLLGGELLAQAGLLRRGPPRPRARRALRRGVHRAPPCASPAGT